MERQKLKQKEWNENPPRLRGGDIFQVAERTHIQQLKSSLPIRKEEGMVCL